MIGERWSRTRSRQSWWELQSFAGRPFGFGLAFVGLWPLLAIVSSWSVYQHPWVAVATYLASQVIVAGLWWQGRRGVHLGVSVSAGAALGVLNVMLALQVPPGQPPGSAEWLGSSGVTIPMALGFSRPIEEPLTVLAVLAITNVVAVARANHDALAVHDAPLHIGLPVAVTVAGLTLVVALRHSAINARRSREQVERLTQRERVEAAVEQERTSRFAPWQEQIAPILEDLAVGRHSVRDPAIGKRCRSLAAAFRADLSSDGESMLHGLLIPLPGIELVIRDLDIGHRLVEADRLALIRLVRAVCSDSDGGALQLTLMPAGDPDAPVTDAIAVLAADGLPQPDDQAGGTLVTETATRWWYDVNLKCEVAPALAANTVSDQIDDE